MKTRIYTLTYILSIYVFHGQTVSLESSNRSPRSTTNLISGLDVVGCGFDVTTLQSRLCLFDLEDTDDNTYWTDPHNRSLTFTVPNGFHVLDDPDFLEVDDIQIIRNIYEFVTRTFYSSRHDSRGFLGFSSSSRSVEMEFIHRRFYQFDYYLASRIRQIGWYTLNLVTFPVPKFNEIASKMMASLPSTFDPNNSSIVGEFNEFFGHFGTHIVVGSTMGGLVWQQDWFESCLLRITNTTWIREQVKKRSGWGLFQSSSTTETRTTVISEQYTKHSEYSLQLLGGTEAINVSKWREWVPTVRHKPRPISYDLLPIHILLPGNSDRRISLEQAALHFRTQADLKERAYISKIEAMPKPPKSRCEKPISKRLLNSDPLQPKEHQMIKRDTSDFQIPEEAQQELCPFVGTEGMRCFNDKPVRTSGRNMNLGSENLPVGVGITLDRSTGRLLAPAVQLTHSHDGSRVWTDGHSGTMFNLFNEARIGSPNRETAAYDVLGIRVYHNASQLDAAWRKTFAEGSVRGGELARAPDMLDYYDKYFAQQDTFVLSQRAIGLYTLALNVSSIQLNKFARRAISKLTPRFNRQLYEDFLNAWGTHIITKSLIGGMVEERAKVKQCLSFLGDDSMTRCIPFSDRSSIASDCSYYTNRSRVISKRRLGGNIERNNENDWKRTLAAGPALLQILDMVPWYDFVDDEAMKENLRTAIRYRLQVADAARTEAVRHINARSSPWYPAFSPTLTVRPNTCLPHNDAELYPPECRMPDEIQTGSRQRFTGGVHTTRPPDDREICNSLVATPLPLTCIVNQFNCRPTSNTDFKVKYERDDSTGYIRVAVYNITRISYRISYRIARWSLRHTLVVRVKNLVLDIPTPNVGPYIQEGCSATTVPECGNIPVGVCMRCASSDPASCQIGDLIHLTLYNIAPTRSMLIFGLLSLRNIQQHRRRIANVTIGQIDRNARRSQRQQSTLTILTLIQVCSITMCNSPADTHKSYSSLTEYMYKSP
ncbi:unnamed protein product [Rotaria magnacalcarata]|uniref:MACPF domain-containing protein n=3 Tax=Rotaria magnacalcarata TaxID=392030 RepID=A0A815KDN6_9BILA|nr:unnamed protein product [Rotaria magnacalcarata]